MKLCQPSTGTWFLECDEFRSWLKSENSKLWVYGIPGAGKTVLTALTIHMISELFDDDHTLAYYYCDYKDALTQDPVNILGSLAKQIVLNDNKAYTLLEEFHCQVSKEGDIYRSARVNDLHDLIVKMTDHLSDVFLVIDGLDECSSNRSFVVKFPDGLNNSSRNNVRILLASRDEQDVRAVLTDYTKISIAARSADIRIYVAAELQRRIDEKQLVLRNPSLKEHIMERLIDKADGI